jgi:transcriptional regulator with XRE-family HTH domain
MKRGTGTDPLDLLIGDRLRTERRRRRISQSALAHALGISPQQVQKYEAGKNRLAASTVIRACRFIGVSVADFCTGEMSELLGAEAGAARLGRAA